MSYRVQNYRCRLIKDGATHVLPRSSAAGACDAYEIFGALMAELPHEELWLLLCNARNAVTGAVRVSQGGLHGCAVLPRDVLRPAIVGAASGVILGHNHPSGDPSPSGEDVAMTHRLYRACEFVGVHLLDHIIWSVNGSTSLADMGLLTPRGER